MLIASDPAELAVRVVRVLTDRDLWQKLSRAGQALASERCSPSVMTERLKQLIDESTRGPVVAVPHRRAAPAAR
jgi:glycosyltransferase involved in cell wall biosynthesis